MATTVLEEFPDHMFLFQCYIFCHVYNKYMYDLCYCCSFLHRFIVLCMFEIKTNSSSS